MRFGSLLLLLTLTILSISLGVVGVAGYHTLKSGDENNIRQELVRQMGFLEAAVLHSDAWQSLAESIEARNGIRVTLIDTEGRVVAESRAQKETMDNHLDREEIRLARSESEGFSVRYSDSTHTNHVYFARMIYIDQTRWFLRVAMEAHTVRTNFESLLHQLLAIFAVATVVAIWLFLWGNRFLGAEVKRLVWLYRAIEEKRAIDALAPFRVREFEEIAQAAARLSKKLAKREKKKKAYQAKIRLKSRQQSEVLSAISHEFKNPIAIIQGYSQTLMDESQMAPAMQTRFLGKIHRSANKLTAMLDRFLLATRLESDDFQLSVVEVPLLELARECMQTFEDRYPDRVIVLEGCERMVRADRMLMEMVLSNLIDNALKYSSEAVTIRIGPDRVSVSDRGIGIESADRDQVVKKFYRTGGRNWDNSMGLGLAIVNFALKRHGTQLEIESEVGQGSIFSFRI